MTAMKAIIYEHYGSPDELKMVEISAPQPGPGEVQVKVMATGLNAADWRMLRADPFLIRLMLGLFRPKSKFKILGSDVAGIVTAVGPDITRLKVGDGVFGEIPARGGLAEFVIANEQYLATIPEGIEFPTAAALPMAGLTALQGLRNVGQIKAGDRVLINGASGGVGTFAVQFAKTFDTTVTAVCSTGKMALARSLGADHVIDYTQEDFTRNGQQYDLIFAANGNSDLSDYARALAPQGRYVMAGGANSQMWQVMLRGPLKSKKGGKSFSGFTATPNRDDLEYLGGLVREGKIKPVIDRCFPLAEAAAAIRYLEEGHARGKIIVTVGRRR